ncbi:hypothetical protein HWV62_37394 [Athelia sp. TMB]|nr:hypothetical protein HWV62_16418 [Athelia sp. TMB]KAF7980613.1 hypothetical protein HWV62_37394 [Athelia sp. TMB]
MSYGNNFSNDQSDIPTGDQSGFNQSGPGGYGASDLDNQQDFSSTGGQGNMGGAQPGMDQSLDQSAGFGQPGGGMGAGQYDSTGSGAGQGGFTSSDQYGQGGQTGAGYESGLGGQGDQYGQSGDQYQSGNTMGSQGQGKVSAGDKILGGMEKMAGKVTRNPGLQEKGINRSTPGDNLGDGNY